MRDNRVISIQSKSKDRNDVELKDIALPVDLDVELHRSSESNRDVPSGATLV
jgi:hypothetical protein